MAIRFPKYWLIVLMTCFLYTGAGAQPMPTFELTPDNTLLNMTDSVGTTSFTYTPNGNVASVTYNYAASGLANAQTLLYTYRADSSRSTLTWKNGAVTVGTWAYAYDAGGRLVGLDTGILPSFNTMWAACGTHCLQRAFGSNSLARYDKPCFDMPQ